MTLDIPAPLQRVTEPEPGFNSDQRTSGRVDIVLSARFMRANRQEYGAQVTDISVGGAAFLMDPEVAAGIVPGEHVIAYIDRLGGLEGTVVRIGPEMVAVNFTISQNKREKLAGQLTFLANEAELADLEARRDERFPLKKRAALLATADGVTRPCLILDVSLSGAAIALASPPEIGTEVWLGRLRGRVVRHHEEGAGLQFMEPLDLSTLMAYFG